MLLGLLFGASAPAAAAAPVYRTPGYSIHRALPTVAPVAPAAPVMVSGDGSDPHVLVDGAGTAHVAWSENPVGQASIMHYCRVLRGAGTCAAPFQDTIMQRTSGENSPATDDDFAGPFPLAIGNELALVDSRCCNNAVIPGGGTTGSPVYLFTSENGGDSFTGPTDPNSAAGTIGNLEPSGNAIVFNGNNPYIGMISDTMTGGTFFQGVPGGSVHGRAGQPRAQRVRPGLRRTAGGGRDPPDRGVRRPQRQHDRARVERPGRRQQRRQLEHADGHRRLQPPDRRWTLGDLPDLAHRPAREPAAGPSDLARRRSRPAHR